MANETKPYIDGRPAAEGEPVSPALGPTVAAACDPAVDPTLAPGPLSQPLGLDLSPGTQVGEYRVLRKLGEGGMGAVYAGEQPTIGKRVAIKVLAVPGANPDLVRRFVEEARAANLIHHPNIIDIFSFGQLPDGRPYFVMELLEGESLSEAIEQHHLQAGELRRLLSQTCNALEASHQAGIVHRDLKPENIWIARPKHGDSYVKLLDFGIAKLLDPTRTNVTQTGAMLGTPLFMSPEQCMGRPVDARSDIYALGVLLYLIFTGHYPFNGNVVTEVILLHVNGTAIPPSRHRPLPPDLDRIILDCLAKEPNARPASAQDLGQRLDAVLGAWTGLSAAALVPGSSPSIGTVPAVAPSMVRAAPGPKRSRLRVGLVLGLGLAAAGALIPIVRHASREQPQARPAEPAPPAPVLPATGRASITIQNGPNNRVLLDGQEVARDQTSVELPSLAAGSSHQLLVEAPGRLRFVQDFVVEKGASVTIPVQLQSEAPAPAEPRAPGKARAKVGNKTAAPEHARAPEPAAKPAESPMPKPIPTTHPSRARKSGLLEDNPLR